MFCFKNADLSLIKIFPCKFLSMVLGLVLFFGGQAVAEEIRAAVATNFLATFKTIAKQFEQDTGHSVVISSGSSGKLYAQIRNGAPFDLFFSADVRRPELLEQEGLAVQGTRFTYAEGRITLWSRDSTLVKGNGKHVLMSSRFTHLAIANPKTAPYGKAAQQTLEGLGVWTEVKSKIVQGENIGQQGSRWDIPTEIHEPLHQQAVLLKSAEHTGAAKSFLQFIKNENSRRIIKEYGYGVE
jgi:molybdate transport system substrate-binding protein